MNIVKEDEMRYEYGDMLANDRQNSENKSSTVSDIQGVPTYNILENPRYAVPFAIYDKQFAYKHKHVASVADLAMVHEDDGMAAADVVQV
jgi:hypothetical protein